MTDCLRFFTRLPLPNDEGDSRSLANALWAAPVAGLVVALIAAAVYALANALGLSASLAAALALAASMLATGCLHEDGLSDTADGFGGGATRERKLEIMRDSRIGAYGTCALMLSILIRWTALADIGGAWHVLAALVATHCASRAMLPAAMHLLPPARVDGLSSSAGHLERTTAAMAAGLGLMSLFAIGVIGALVAAATLVVAFALFQSLCRRQIRGQTGDTLGALQQLGEAIVLIVATAFLT